MLIPNKDKENPPKGKPYINLGNCICLNCNSHYCVCKERQNGTWENHLPIVNPIRHRGQPLPIYKISEEINKYLTNVIRKCNEIEYKYSWFIDRALILIVFGFVVASLIWLAIALVQ